MRVLLSAIGSDGDVEPFLALGQRLRAAGHQPLLASGDRFAARAAALGVAFVQVGSPWDQALAEETFARVLALRSPLAQLTLITQVLADLQREMVPDLLRLARDTDVIVYPPTAIASAAVARKTNTPHVSVQFAPMRRAVLYSPTGANYGRLINRALWSIAGGVLARATDPVLNQVVQSAGLAAWRDIVLDAGHSSALDLVAVSPAVVEADPTWPAAMQFTGYWFTDEAGWTPDAALEKFVCEAEPPLVIGFGSMLGMDVRATTARIMEAASGLHRKVVLQGGWAGLGAGALPPNVHLAGFVPHAWLFSRAAAVIHHGGAGTTAAALRAGIPQAIAWHLGDQAIWGLKVAQLGVGPKARSYRQADATWLRSVGRRLLEDETLRACAQQFGQRIRAEDGVGKAVHAIEQLVR